MFPDPITPKSYPDKLQDPSYDPFVVMPAKLPPHPRVFTNGAQLARARKRIATGNPVDTACLETLVRNCRLDEPLPSPIRFPDKEGLVGRHAHAAARNAVAFLLTGHQPHRDRAIGLLRLVARACPRAKWTGFEHGPIIDMAIAYDCLAVRPLGKADDRLFHDMLSAMPARLNLNSHRYCNNHNAMSQSARLAVGAALGHVPTIHDTLYGLQTPTGWRYGMIHTLRHDILADGMQWEGTMGYHMVVAVMLAESLTILENCGVDLWHREFPSLVQDDGHDEFRGWGPKGMKCVKAMLDVFFYQMFPNGDYSNLHDQILGSIGGANAWWPLFPKGYEVYRDPKYAWLLDRMQKADPGTPPSPVPPWLRGDRGEMAFVRIECRKYPKGRFSLAKDADISLVGRNVNGCSLLPVNGSAVLRIAPDREDSPAAMFYWGPHWAGHRSPAALHVDIHAGARRITHAPHIYKGGYDDPRHLTWCRSTIAHNTVTVDQQSMFPYDFETNSAWEYDHWRDTISDGVLESFRPERAFKLIRASNDNVYRGVKLDRTILLTQDYLVDVYRAAGDRIHQYDWAMHVCSPVERPARASNTTLGQKRGYAHFTEAWRHPAKSGCIHLPLVMGSYGMCVQILLPAQARLIVARDPEPDDRTPIGDREKPGPRTALIVRSRGKQALFVSVWHFTPGSAPAVRVRGATDSDVSVFIGTGRRQDRWRFPVYPW